jgi:hypothetical protein
MSNSGKQPPPGGFSFPALFGAASDAVMTAPYKLLYPGSMHQACEDYI